MRHTLARIVADDNTCICSVKKNSPRLQYYICHHTPVLRFCDFVQMYRAAVQNRTIFFTKSDRTTVVR